MKRKKMTTEHPKRDSRTVIIAAGSFQGKSLIALHAANLLNFSCVITTDLIRNLLKQQFPEASYLSTSTYRLSSEYLQKQTDRVSKAIMKIVPIYLERGEHLLIEGMHFTRRFLKWSADHEFCGICLNNVTPLHQRIVLKSITRTRLRVGCHDNPENGYEQLDHTNVMASAYLRYADNIEGIHSDLKRSCEDCRFQLIEFDDIKIGKTETLNWIKTFYTH